MLTGITGIAANGVVIPNSPLPEGTKVDIQVRPDRPEAAPRVTACFTAKELRTMPRAERQAVLSAAAALAEADYLHDKDLTSFDAFREEDFDDDSQ